MSSIGQKVQASHKVVRGSHGARKLVTVAHKGAWVEKRSHLCVGKCLRKGPFV